MALIHSTMASFYGGVSQQTSEIKLNNQCNEMINMVPSIAEGLQRRLPSNILMEINDIHGTTEYRGNPYFYSYDRGDKLEKYLMILWSGLWHVYNEEGTLVNSGEDNYLICSNPSVDLQCITIKDSTFVLNKKKTVDMTKVEEADTTVDVSTYKYTPYIRTLYMRDALKGAELINAALQNVFGFVGKIRCSLKIGGTYYTGDSDDINETAPGNLGQPSKFKSFKTEAQLALTRAMAAGPQGDLVGGTYTFADETLVQIHFTLEPIYDAYQDAIIEVGEILLDPYLVDNEYQDEFIIDADVHDNGASWSITEESNWENYFFYWVKETGPSGDEFNYRVILNDDKYRGTGTGVNTDTTQSWIPNSLVGLYVRDKITNLSGKITANTATTLTVDSGTVFDVGNDYYFYVNETGTNSSVIARLIESQINLLGDANLVAESNGAVVRVKISQGWLAGFDSWGNQAHENWRGSVSSINKLPGELGFPNTVILIEGNKDNDYDDYYVRWDDGIYKETFKPGTHLRPSHTSMPHRLVRGLNSDGVTPNFSFLELDGIVRYDGYGNTLSSTYDKWGKRNVGDETTSPDPSFIGSNITNMFLFENRLGMLSEGNIIMSEVNEYFNYFPSTVTDVLDGDAIDVSIDVRNTLRLREAIPYQKDLLLFGDNAQFILSSQGPLTSRSISVKQSTSYDYNSNASPLLLGPNVYFSLDKDNFSKVREYYIVPDSTINDADDITSHVPKYIPRGIKKMVGTTQNDMIFSLSALDLNTIYVYNYGWSGSEKIQSAWHKWTFGEDIYNIEILNKKLYILFRYENDYTMKVIDLELPSDISNIGYADHVGTTIDEGDIYALYESRFDFSTWGISSTSDNIDDFRKNLKVKNVEISSELQSYYNLSSTYKNRSQFIVNKNVVSDDRGTNKFRMSGYIKDMDISIRNYQDKGLKLTSATFEGNYSPKSKGV